MRLLAYMKSHKRLHWAISQTLLFLTPFSQNFAAQINEMKGVWYLECVRCRVLEKKSNDIDAESSSTRRQIFLGVQISLEIFFCPCSPSFMAFKKRLCGSIMRSNEKICADWRPWVTFRPFYLAQEVVTIPLLLGTNC